MISCGVDLYTDQDDYHSNKERSTIFCKSEVTVEGPTKPTAVETMPLPEDMKVGMPERQRQRSSARFS